MRKLECVGRCLLSLLAIKEPHDCYTLHEAANTVSEEFATRLKRPVYSDVVFWRHEEIAALGRVV